MIVGDCLRFFDFFLQKIMWFHSLSLICKPLGLYNINLHNIFFSAHLISAIPFPDLFVLCKNSLLQLLEWSMNLQMRNAFEIVLSIFNIKNDKKTFEIRINPLFFSSVHFYFLSFCLDFQLCSKKDNQLLYCKTLSKSKDSIKKNDNLSHRITIDVIHC